MMYLVTLISFVSLLWEIYKFTHPGFIIKFKQEGKELEKRKEDENYKRTTEDTEHAVRTCLVGMIALVNLPVLIGALFFDNIRVPAALMLGLAVFGVFIRSLFKSDAFTKTWTFIDSGLSIPIWIWLIQGAVYPEFNLVHWIR